MPMVMSSIRPAALSLGPMAKPRSRAVMVAALRLARRASASIPGRPRPARMRFRPWATKMRLLRSSLATSATVPKATRSSRSARFGSATLRVSNQSTSRRRRRSASST
jgi:hypothetical protein